MAEYIKRSEALDAAKRQDGQGGIRRGITKHLPDLPVT